MRMSNRMILSILAIIGLSLVVSAQVATDGALQGESEWPMFRHDPSHAGYTTSTGPETNNILWSYDTESAIGWSSPAVAEGKVFIGGGYDASTGTVDGKVYALDALTGVLLWTYQTGDEVHSSPAVSNGKVYVGSYDNNVYCLDATTGGVLWTFQTGWLVFSSPAIADGRIYIGSYDRKVYCLDALTGYKIWEFLTGDVVISSPAVTDGKVYVGSRDGKVYCLDAYSGDKLWHFMSASGGEGPYVYSSPAVSEGKVYIGTHAHKIYCLNALTGDKIWDFATEWNVRSAPAVHNGYVYVGEEGYNYHGKFYCLDAATGLEVWRYDSPSSQMHCSPAIADGKVFVGDGLYYEPGSVYAFDAYTGAIIWRYQTGGHVTSSPAVVDDKVYIGSSDGNIYCFGTPNTPEGENVVVDFPDADATITYQTVTSQGTTAVTQTGTGPSPPTGFKLGTPPIYYDATTTATYAGTITICLIYDETQFANERNLKLMHWDSGWHDVTTSFNPESNSICGEVTGFSLLAIMEAPITVSVDLDPDTLNLKSNGQWVTAYVTLPEGYAVDEIASSTVTIEGISSEWSEVQDSVFMAKFDRATIQTTLTNEPDYDTAPKFYDLTLTVTGQLTDGTDFDGSDTITVIKK